jgi:N6-L-threonylcarbamoyladenine synthase
MEAHLFANSLESPDATPPFVALLVSGGHTLLLYAEAWGRYRLLGETRDDAAGEAFDKVARRLGLGFPGGPEIQRVAGSGRADRFDLPRPMLGAGDRPEDPGWLDFSFSGLKTAVSLLADELESRQPPGLEEAVPDVAASFQAAVVDVLVGKVLRAVEATGCDRVLLGGGVARNGPLRERLAAALAPDGVLFVPSPRFASDNGAMVARLAEHRLGRGESSGWDLNADPSLPFPGLTRQGRNADAHRGRSGACTPS